MAHARESIRKAVVTAVTSLTTTSTRVHSRPLHTHLVADLPNLSVVTANGPETKSSSFENEYSSMEMRALPVTIEGRVCTLTDYEDTLDDIAAEVEAAMMTNAALWALANDVELLSTAIEIDGDGEKPVGVITMEWVVTYRVDSTAPTTAQK